MRLAFTDLAIQRLKHPEKGQVRHFDTQLPSFGLTVGTKTKTFIVMHGRDRKVTTIGRYGEGGITLKEARQEARRILADPNAPKARRTYQEAVVAFEMARAGHVKAATLKRYRYYLDTLAFKCNMADLTKADIKTGLAKWEGKKRAQNACHAALRTFLNWCVEEEIIDRHPVFRSRAPNNTPSRDRVLTDAELVAIWNATDHAPYGNLIRLLMCSAARKMEIRHLVVEGDYITFKATKNKLDHSLPITPLIRAHLISEPYKFDNWEREKRRLDERCKVYGWRVHDLRRTWATNAIRLGVTSDTVEAVLNHKKQGVQAVYQRWKYTEEMREALLTVEAHLVKITTARVQPEPSTAPNGVRDETVIEKAST